MFISWNNGIYSKGVAVSSIYMIYSDFPQTVDSTLPLYKILSFMCLYCVGGKEMLFSLLYKYMYKVFHKIQPFYTLNAV